MSITRLECQVSKMINSDTCSRPTTGATTNHIFKNIGLGVDGVGGDACPPPRVDVNNVCFGSYTGGDPGDELDMCAIFKYTVCASNNCGGPIVSDATFTSDHNTLGFTLVAQNLTDPWMLASNFGEDEVGSES